VWTKFSVAQPPVRTVKLLQRAQKTVCRPMARTSFVNRPSDGADLKKHKEEALGLGA